MATFSSTRGASRAGSPVARFALALSLVLALKWGSLGEPPFWDAAMGLFPAAITLASNGFDLVDLLGRPGYLEGGPNAHATSLVTLATALVLAAAGGGGTRAFLVLHLLHFAVAAWTLATLHRLAQPMLGARAAALFCLAVLLHPTFSAQVGSLYVEVVLCLCAVSAIHAWTAGRFRTAVIWGALAYATKETGIIVAATLAFATLLERRGPRDKATRIALILMPAAAWTAAEAVLGWVAAGGEGFALVPSLDAVFGGIGQYMARFLMNVPDLIVYFAVFAVAAIASARPLLRALREEPTAVSARSAERAEQLVMGLTGLAIVFFVLLFLVALPIVAGFTIVLPRYYVIILPFLLLWTGYAVKRLSGRHARPVLAALFVSLSALFAVNTNGALYPLDIDTEGPGNDPALTERSNAYRRLLALELEAVRALEELPRGVPVYYGHFEHYLFRYPNLGYARGPLADGHNFAVEPLAPLVAADAFPPCVYALYNYPWLGGEKLRGLIGLPSVRPELTAEIVRELRDGRYVILLVRISRRDADCSP